MKSIINFFKNLFRSIFGGKDEGKPVVIPAPNETTKPVEVPDKQPEPTPIEVIPEPVIIPTEPPIVVEPLPIPVPPVLAPEPVKPDPVIEVKPEPVKPPVTIPLPKPDPKPEPLPPAAKTLKDSPIKWGVAFKESSLKNQKVIDETYKHFSSVTPENGIKEGHVQKKKGVFDFSDPKALVKIAKANGLRVHGHVCFVWPSQEKNKPAFWHEAGKSKDAYIAHLKFTVQSIVKEFKNDIFSWDIVNEAHQDNGKLRPCYALTHMGETYIEQIAKWVLEVQPDAKCFISDYDFETESKKATVVIAYAGELRKRGLVYGISSQMHTSLGMSYKNFTNRLKEMAKQNLLVHLSELDIKCKPEQEKEKAAKYKEVAAGFRTLPVALQYGITVWSHVNAGNFMNQKKNPAPYAPAIFDNDFNGGLSLPAILEVK